VSRRRFLVREAPAGGRAVLDPDTARHALKVLRLGEGDAVVLFDGRGTEWDGVVERASKKGVLVRAGEARPAAAPRGPRVVLATAAPKGKRATTLLAMATEAGADAFVPVRFARSAVAGVGPSKAAHWARAVEEAARQCGRAWLPTLEPETPLAEFLARDAGAGDRRLLASPEGAPLPRVLAAGAAPERVVLLVGPEGGITPEEETAARAAGFEPCSLGPHILRVESAAVAAVVLVRGGGA
jgi:16S rRNA (uracil1498-N3)-methyltransferase